MVADGLRRGAGESAEFPTDVNHVLARFVHERVKKTALLLRGSLSISLVEVPILSTSPNMILH
jgi:hypothetical protein